MAPTISRWRHYVLVRYVRPSVSIILQVCERDNIVTNRLWEFHHIYKLSAGRDKDEVIRFWGQNVKGQGHDETKYAVKNHLFKMYISGEGTGRRFTVESIVE